MIDQADHSLLEWVRKIVAPEIATLGRPGPEESGPGKGAGVLHYMMEIAGDPPARGSGVAPLQVALRYLVTAQGKNQDAEHRVLGDLLFAALDPSTPGRPELEVVLAPPGPGLWTALGTYPRPCFVLQVPARKERPQRQAKMVLDPLIVQGAPMVDFAGRLLGPGDVPLAGAEIELPGLDRWTRTDGAGRFVLRAVPATARRSGLIVRAKGTQRSFAGDQLADEPLVLRLAKLDP